MMIGKPTVPPTQTNTDQTQNTVRLKIIGNDIIKNVGKYQSCMVSKLPIIFKRTRTTEG